MYRALSEESKYVISAVRGVVAAYRIDTGEVGWRFTPPEGSIQHPGTSAMFVSENHVLVAAARVHSKGMFASADATIHLFCLDYTTGRVTWHQTITEGVNIGRAQVSLRVQAGRVLVAHNGVLFAYALESGEPSWRRPIVGAQAGIMDAVLLAGPNGPHAE